MNTLPLFKRNVLVSIRPEYIARILSGEKTVELRRRFPEAAATGATAFLYSSSPVQAVVARAHIADVRKLRISKIWKDCAKETGITKGEFDKYFDGLEFGFAIFLEDVRALKQQFKASDLWDECQIVPPQSYRYLHEGHGSLFEHERIQTPHRHKRRNRT